MAKARGQEALRITLTRSPIGTPKSHRVWLRGLGLRRIRHTVVRPNTSQVQGLIHKLSYMITVEKVT
ncbi:MAG: 50S ribosomal protein L30 [Nitrospirae bacterium]|nr:MAG: 50S ribosomal protein L30 [Nitrospirota bacterium]